VGRLSEQAAQYLDVAFWPRHRRRGLCSLFAAAQFRPSGHANWRNHGLALRPAEPLQAWPEGQHAAAPAIDPLPISSDTRAKRIRGVSSSTWTPSASLGLEVRISDCGRSLRGGFDPLRGSKAAISALPESYHNATAIRATRPAEPSGAVTSVRTTVDRKRSSGPLDEELASEFGVHLSSRESKNPQVSRRNRSSAYESRN